VQWQGCTGFLTSLKGCTNTKKVDNHCVRLQVLSSRCILNIKLFVTLKYKQRKTSKASS